MKNLITYIGEKLIINKDLKNDSFGYQLAHMMFPFEVKRYDDFIQKIEQWTDKNHVEDFSNINIWGKNDKYAKSVIEDTDFLKKVNFDNLYINQDINRVYEEKFKVWEYPGAQLYIHDNTLLFVYGIGVDKYYILIRQFDYGTLG